MWPPALAALKADLGIADERDDAILQVQLDAAAAFVERARAGDYAFGDPLSELPEVTAEVVLGTIRLAGRWHTRRRSPDGVVSMGELGTGRVPGVDPDIERMLRIGRFRGMRFA